MKINRRILIIFVFLFLVYLCFYAFEFEIRTRTDFWIIPTQILISASLFILIFFLRMKWFLKLVICLGFIYVLFIGLSQTGIWKFSLKRYVRQEKENYLKLVNEIDKTNEQRLSYVSCFSNEINLRPKLNYKENSEIFEAICKQIMEVDCLEVSLNKETGKYLFVMSRFIDNGYGLLYCKHDGTFEQILNERIDGLQITSIVKAENNWYYVSFT